MIPRAFGNTSIKLHYIHSDNNQKEKLYEIIKRKRDNKTTNKIGFTHSKTKKKSNATKEK